VRSGDEKDARGIKMLFKRINLFAVLLFCAKFLSNFTNIQASKKIQAYF
jgi:hypothetical protein